MVERDEKFPPPVEIPDDVEQSELPLVDDIEPKEPTPNVDEGSVPAEDRDDLPATHA